MEQFRNRLRNAGKDGLIAVLDMFLHVCRWDDVAGLLGKELTE